MNWVELGGEQKGVWYEKNDSDTVIVFIHGITSNNQAAWLYEDKKDRSKSVFWPDLILKDPTFDHPSIFLASYFSAYDSKRFGIRECAIHVFENLKSSGIVGKDKKKIVFIGHSMGGIIARYMLNQFREEYKAYQIGLFLIASPSKGSKYANSLAEIINFYGNLQAKQLMTDSQFLDDLDKTFKDLVYRRMIPGLKGKEVFETEFYVPNRLFPAFQLKNIVPEESAGRYFGAPTPLPRTNHSNCVHPTNVDHASHVALSTFWNEPFPALDKNAELEKADIQAGSTETAHSRVERTNDIESNPPPLMTAIPSKQSTMRFRVAFSFAGEKRNYVEQVAELLASQFGKDQILYDRYHEEEFARGDLGVYLPDLYHDHAELIVPIFCKEYEKKDWPGVEWLSIQDRLKQRDFDCILFSRFDHALCRGIYSNSGFVELDNKTPHQFADLILKRLLRLSQISIKSEQPTSQFEDIQHHSGADKILMSVPQPAETITNLDLAERLMKLLDHHTIPLADFISSLPYEYRQFPRGQIDSATTTNLLKRSNAMDGHQTLIGHLKSMIKNEDDFIRIKEEILRWNPQ